MLGATADDDRDAVIRAFRAKAHKHHPDHGGDAETFRRLVEARDLLLQFVGEKVEPVEIKTPKAPEFEPLGTPIRYVMAPLERSRARLSDPQRALEGS